MAHLHLHVHVHLRNPCHHTWLLMWHNNLMRFSAYSEPCCSCCCCCCLKARKTSLLSCLHCTLTHTPPLHIHTTSLGDTFALSTSFCPCLSWSWLFRNFATENDAYKNYGACNGQRILRVWLFCRLLWLLLLWSFQLLLLCGVCVPT